MSWMPTSLRSTPRTQRSVVSAGPQRATWAGPATYAGPAYMQAPIPYYPPGVWGGQQPVYMQPPMWGQPGTLGGLFAGLNGVNIGSLVDLIGQGCGDSLAADPRPHPVTREPTSRTSRSTRPLWRSMGRPTSRSALRFTSSASCSKRRPWPRRSTTLPDATAGTALVAGPGGSSPAMARCSAATRRSTSARGNLRPSPRDRSRWRCTTWTALPRVAAVDRAPDPGQPRRDLRRERGRQPLRLPGEPDQVQPAGDRVPRLTLRAALGEPTQPPTSNSDHRGPALVQRGHILAIVSNGA